MLKALQVGDLGLPHRPMYSREGNDVKLWANYVELAPPKGLQLYWYAVSVKYEKDKSAPATITATGTATKRRAPKDVPEGIKLAKIIAEVLDVNLKKEHNAGRVVSDFSKTVLSLDDLMDHKDVKKNGVRERRFVVNYRHELDDPEKGEVQRYAVTITPAQEKQTDVEKVLDLDRLLTYIKSSDPNDSATPISREVADFVTSVNMWLRHYAKMCKFRPAGNRLPREVAGSKTFRIGKGFELPFEGSLLAAIQGYSSSIRLGAGRMLVNVNVSTGAFYKGGNLADLIRGCFGNAARLTADQYHYLDRLLRGVKVMLVIRKGSEQLKKISGLAHKSDIDAVNRANEKKERDRRDPNKNPKEVPPDEHPPKFFPRAPEIGISSGEVAFHDDSDEKNKRYIRVFDNMQKKYGKHDRCRTHPFRETDLVVNLGRPGSPRYYPVQLCDVLPNQFCRQKVEGKDSEQMIKKAKMDPLASVRKIVEEGLDTIGLASVDDSSLPMQVFNPSKDIVTVWGRQLKPPTLMYGALEVTPKVGSWNMASETPNGPVKKYSKAGTLPSRWMILIAYDGPTAPTKKYQDDSKDILIAKMKDRGISVPEDPYLHAIPYRRESIKDIMEWCEKKHYTFVAVLLPNNNKALYNYLKQQGDTVHGVRTACMLKLHDTFNDNDREREMYRDNVLLKINLKLGGTNQKLKLGPNDLDLLQANDTMIVGIDVTHPPPGAPDTAQSIAGMVASVDSTLGQWPGTWSFQQKANQEISTDKPNTDTGKSNDSKITVTDEEAIDKNINNLSAMLKTHLLRWHSKHPQRQYPQNILVYRDGVSEGQYEQVVTHELTALQKACAELYTKEAKPPQPVPKITIVVVVKRHHTRFYAHAHGPSDKKLRCNPSPGTAVDCGVTSQFLWEFFLQSHEAIMGVARPGHYVVVWDEIFRDKYNKTQPAAELEKVTHALCYVFGRATRAIGVCAPARLADMLCDRARLYNSDVYGGDKTSSGGGGGGGRVERVSDAVADTMFYV